MGDQELLLLLEQNPEEGIHRLMDLYGGAILTICRNFLYDCPEHDIEETVADTYIHFWKNRRRFVPDERHSVKSYLYAIARNAARDKRRKLKRQDFFSLDEVDLELPSGQNVEEDYEKKKTEEILHTCLQSMREPDRSVFLYRYFYGFRVKQIADILELTPKKIENILYRGKEKLRTALLKGGISGEDEIG
ncbi:MAG: sigma-70 family RNA polymerase sigma factor [Fusicatenibacter sp.]|nr:sigma-70 family RNA polymerase sigma factor [Lachnospiraceae bacterium]MDY2937864.1 sigma-70 family RNA polymerase sigma factor [Fusicatenibacter sp.]